MAVATVLAGEVEGVFFLVCPGQPLFMPVSWYSMNSVLFTLRGVLIWRMNYMVTLLVGELWVRLCK